MLIEFDGLAAIIEVPDHSEFLEDLNRAAPDWPFGPASRDGTPIARVRRSGAGYEVLSSWNEDTAFSRASAVSAACSVIVDVVTSYVEAHPARLCLHGGAVEIGGRLVVMPSRSRAGKSTLIARLAADGCAVFGDDVLPLDETDCHGLALGLAPRPRIPLPANASPEFRRFIASRASMADDRYLYLDLKDRLAGRGATAPLGAILLLDRRDTGRARLHRAPRPDTLKALIRQNVARAESATSLLARLHHLMDRIPRLGLVYSDLDDAAELIQRTFTGWPLDPERHVLPDPAEGPEAAAEAPPPAGPSLSPDQAWRCNPAVSLRMVDGEAFLADPGDTAIRHLNVVGAGLWSLLGEGIDQPAAVAVLHGAFPDIDRGVIARDVAALFADLAAADLILPEKG